MFTPVAPPVTHDRGLHVFAVPTGGLFDFHQLGIEVCFLNDNGRLPDFVVEIRCGRLIIVKLNAQHGSRLIDAKFFIDRFRRIADGIFVRYVNFVDSFFSKGNHLGKRCDRFILEWTAYRDIHKVILSGGLVFDRDLNIFFIKIIFRDQKCSRHRLGIKTAFLFFFIKCQLDDRRNRVNKKIIRERHLSCNCGGTLDNKTIVPILFERQLTFVSTIQTAYRYKCDILFLNLSKILEIIGRIPDTDIKVIQRPIPRHDPYGRCTRCSVVIPAVRLIVVVSYLYRGISDDRLDGIDRRFNDTKCITRVSHRQRGLFLSEIKRFGERGRPYDRNKAKESDDGQKQDHLL